MLDLLVDPFREEIGRLALLQVSLMGLACGPLGVWIVLYRQSYAAESIAHAALPGLVVASLAGLPLLLGAGTGLALAAVLVAIASQARNIGADSAVAVVITTMFGAGILLALNPEVPANLSSILFGDPLGVSRSDLLASAALVIVVVLALMGAHRSLSLAGFDPQAAPSLGTRPGRVELGLLILLALATMVAIQALGNLLVVALLVAPGAAALRWSQRLVRALLLAAAIAVGAGLAGIYASYHLEVAAGAAIALASLVPFALSMVAVPVRRSRRQGASPVDLLTGEA
jgi:ABC-type Mn2+/Zn2+ transport system permease subunit